MIEPSEVVAVSPQADGIRVAVHGSVEAIERRARVGGSMTIAPLDNELTIDDGGRMRLGRSGGAPWLPATLVGLHDSTRGARTVVAQPIGNQRGGAINALQFEARRLPRCRHECSSGKQFPGGAHCDLIERAHAKFLSQINPCTLPYLARATNVCDQSQRSNRLTRWIAAFESS